MKLIIAVEEEFDLAIPDDKFCPYITTVKDLYDAVICCLKEQKEIELKKIKAINEIAY